MKIFLKSIFDLNEKSPILKVNSGYHTNNWSQRWTQTIKCAVDYAKPVLYHLIVHFFQQNEATKVSQIGKKYWKYKVLSHYLISRQTKFQIWIFKSKMCATLGLIYLIYKQILWKQLEPYNSSWNLLPISYFTCLRLSPVHATSREKLSIDVKITSRSRSRIAIIPC